MPSAKWKGLSVGEAQKRKKIGEQNARARAAIDPAKVAQAVKKTMGAITDMEGSDCLGYAIIGAALLNHLGLQARPVVGHSSWRVGPGDGDMVVHDPNALATTVFSPATIGQQKAGMFHVWIECDGPDGVEVIDFTTFQLADKARALDAMDGGKTQVDFCPDFIWEKAPAPHWTGRSVAQAPHAGIFSYKRVPQIEGFVLAQVNDSAIQSAVAMAIHVHKKLANNENVQVIGIDSQNGNVQTSAPKMVDQIMEAIDSGALRNHDPSGSNVPMSRNTKHKP
jgi:hypothetical protein